MEQNMERGFVQKSGTKRFARAKLRSYFGLFTRSFVLVVVLSLVVECPSEDNEEGDDGTSEELG